MAAGLGKPIPQPLSASQQESVQAHIHDNENAIRGLDTSPNAPMAAAAKDWISALANSDVAGVEQAAAKMDSACHDLGIQPLKS
jgi:hypothetical protein